MADVVYYWPEGDVLERCKLEYGTAEQTAYCFHCGGLIEQKTEIAKLLSGSGEARFLHKECAKKNCNFNPKKRMRPNKRLSDFIK